MPLIKMSKIKLVAIVSLLSTAIFNQLFAQQKEQVIHQLNNLLVNTVMEDLFTPPSPAEFMFIPICFL